MRELIPPFRDGTLDEAAHNAVDTADSFPASDPPGWLPLRVGAPERDAERSGNVVISDRAITQERLSQAASGSGRAPSVGPA